MPLVITAVFLLAIVFVVFAVYAHADNQGRRDRDCSRSQTRPPSTP
ncbi:hypothetical protein ACFUN7_24320 [Streptomyces sp. NPDC057236]